MKILYKPSDKRYELTYEYCGYSIPMICVRFCKDLIGVCRNETGAERVINQHVKERQKAIRTNQTQN